MLLVKPKRSKRIYSFYTGGGVFSDLTKKFFSKGIKDVINTAAKSAIAQKVTNAVVSGATTEAEKALKNAVSDTVNHLKSKRKRKNPTAVTTAAVSDLVSAGKKAKININNLINGSGIVLD